MEGLNIVPAAKHLVVVFLDVIGGVEGDPIGAGLVLVLIVLLHLLDLLLGHSLEGHRLVLLVLLFLLLRLLLLLLGGSFVCLLVFLVGLGGLTSTLLKFISWFERA